MSDKPSDKPRNRLRSKLRTAAYGAAGGLALTAVLVSAPAQASASSTLNYRNAHTGLCLAGATDRTVSQYSCSVASQFAPGVTWQWVNDAPLGLLKNTATGMCLDTNGADVYLSGCNTADRGQLWMYTAGSYQLTSLLAGGALTGWNAGTVSVSPVGDVDVINKQHWSM
ncbi:ricin-type beta-trefoil lectin domain protein [Streptomyces sp. NBC_00102]|uniref:ricin-type beta-trefoil lectin domain protein n=1 Tax=Streptomyces sp. NBC_00102 TaxID=2975652 RepID=UPI00224FEF99|nr:ricin-type beta-trefoil lectin domain protein [Streptomyces sp. NBC_00102]MCX5400467.1 RICIN domain-containing protein [Streptomyces sp. NBC_00102]